MPLGTAEAHGRHALAPETRRGYAADQALVAEWCLLAAIGYARVTAALTSGAPGTASAGPSFVAQLELGQAL